MNFPTLLYTIREHCKIIIPPHFSSTCLTQWRLHLLDIWNQKLDFHILEMREKSHSEIVWLQIGKLIRSRQEIYIGAADSRQFSTRREKSRVAFKLFLSFKVEMNVPPCIVGFISPSWNFINGNLAYPIYSPGWELHKSPYLLPFFAYIIKLSFIQCFRLVSFQTWKTTEVSF